MSRTRHAPDDGAPMRAERFASSACLPRNILGNLVGKRCETLRDARERGLIHFVHELSLRDGYTLHPSCNLFPRWPWPSPVDESEPAFQRVGRELTELFPERIAPRHRARFIRAAPVFLTRLCLDPAADLRTVRDTFFEDTIGALFIYKGRFEAATAALVASTSAQRTIAETLDYGLSQRGIVLVEGTYRIGKSYAAQAWALAHLGQCRYAQLSSATDDTAFYRTIARSLGAACGLKMKAAEIRQRIEETIRGQHLLLIFDEADYLWPQSIELKASPNRVNWLMTAVVNNGVSVALIASKNFSRMLAHVERRCPIWGSEQFLGRIKLRRALPESLEQADLFAIAALLLPDADQPTRMLLVGHALKSEGYVAALESAASRAKFFAAQEARPVSFEDVARVMEECGTFSPRAVPATPPQTPRGLPAANRLPLGKANRHNQFLRRSFTRFLRLPRRTLGAAKNNFYPSAGCPIFWTWDRPH